MSRAYRSAGFNINSTHHTLNFSICLPLPIAKRPLSIISRMCCVAVCLSDRRHRLLNQDLTDSSITVAMAFYATEKVVATTLPYKINKLLLFFRFKAHSAPADKFIQTCKHIVRLTRLWCQDRSVVHEGPQVRQSNFFVQTRTWRVADGLVKG